jgi:cytochrome oxidase Cu insertion factor (SCO1/SenC/PrrC family)
LALRPARPRTEAPLRHAAAALVLVALAGCSREALPVLGTIPAFSLTERAGTPVSAKDLEGKIWVADFIFTRCPDVCPALSGRMSALRKELAANGTDGVTMVSISVDPNHDTPDVLSSYAGRFGGGDDWLFLTGPRETIAGLLRDGFKVAFADGGPPTAPITHSDRFVLVDPHLQVRGYYHGLDDASVDKLVDDVATLRAERG